MFVQKPFLSKTRFPTKFNLPLITENDHFRAKIPANHGLQGIFTESTYKTLELILEIRTFDFEN